LELPAQELDQHIEEEVEKNPALEAEEATDPSVEGLQIELPGRLLTAAKAPASAEENEPSDWNGYETDSYREPKIPLEEPEDFYGPFNFGTTQSLYESLIEQLAAFELQPWEREVVEFIIYNLTPEGLLAVPLEKLARQYAYQEGKEVPLSEWERLLQQVVHKLEPPGIGARNLLEALRLQIEALDSQEEPLKPLLWKLVTEYGPALEKGQWERIRRRMGLEEATWKALVRRLASLNPRPGLAASDEVAPAVTPDFILHLYEDGTFQVEVALLPAATPTRSSPILRAP
jgi:RNA polymerase sigma-54 factor